MRQRGIVLLAVVVLLALTACSGTDQTSPETTAPTPTTSTTIAGSQTSAEPIPPPVLDPDLEGEALLVAIEARWMCDIQRFAFPDLAAMNEALEERLSPHGLGRAEYDSFKMEIEDRIELRELVLAEYESYCGED